MAPLLSRIFSCRTGAHTSAVHKACWVVIGEVTDICYAYSMGCVMTTGHSILILMTSAYSNV